MSKFRVSGNKSSILVYPTVKPELSLDLVNNPEGIDPAYSFTRNSAATYVDADGYIKTAGINQPRFEYDLDTGEYKGLLIEESRANLVPNSDKPSLLPSTEGFGDLIPVSSVTTLTPKGNQSVWRFTVPSSWSQNPRRLIRFPVVNATVTYSCFMKGITNNALVLFGIFNGTSTIEVNLSTGSIGFKQGFGHKVQYYGNGWWRVFTSGFINSSGAFGQNFGWEVATANAQFYAFGVQIEVGSYGTSYITTGGSTVTRQPDQLLINKPINLNGTFFIESSISNLKNQQTLFNANDGTNSFTLKNSNGEVKQKTTNYASNNYSTIDTDYTKRIISYQNSKNVFMSSSNIEDSVDAKTPGNLSFTPNTISIGYDNLNADRLLNGYIKKFSYYSKALTDNECRALVNDKQPLNYFAPIVVGGDDVYQINVNGDTYIVHRFLDVGTSSLFLPIALEVEYLVVGGGGGGSIGGGGAGGFLTGSLALSASSVSVLVGSGGLGTASNGTSRGVKGGDTTFGAVTAIGGGGGGTNRPSGQGVGGDGGSGGGGGAWGGVVLTGGSGTSGQGNQGGSSNPNQPYGGGGGGGAGAVGGNASGNAGGSGGNGLSSSITGASVFYAGGGGASAFFTGVGGTGGLGGGGAGSGSGSVRGADGIPNTGGGGGGSTGFGSFLAGKGGSGIVIVRYKV